MKSKSSKTAWIVFGIIVAVVIFVLIISSALKQPITSNGLALIRLDGPISLSSQESFFERASPTRSIMQQLDEADKNQNVKAILLEINSPGGTVIASKELANKVKSLEKPVIALIEEVGASGAYWVASSADKIVADSLSITGSIGVTGSYLEFSNLFEKYGVTYQEVKGGKYKEIGSPFKDLTPEEQRVLQNKINLIHERFLEEVANNRNLETEQIAKISTGEFFLGEEAINLGLVDILGGENEAIETAKQLTGLEELEIVDYTPQPTFFESLFGLSSYYVGRGIGAELTSLRLENSLEIIA
ncbi:MAG: signal peptide peptidase SppA [Candidatus Woesearchaeota archaeon]|nr:MAG: signal peptide peptidase SppA [Candidatus Woesearchaeota archaeon]